MDIHISETAYLFYLSSEIAKSKFWGLSMGITYFPTLNAEASLGFDAKFDKKGKPLFVQTKMPKYYKKSDSSEWWYFKKLYYRFPIYPNNKSHQHNLLVDLGMKFRNSVFYVAPLFHDEHNFSTYVKSSKLIENSKFIKTTNLPLIFGDDKHVICYSKGTKSKMWSEEFTIEDSFDGELFISNLENIETVSFQKYLMMIRTSIDDYVKKDNNRNYNPLSELRQLGILPVFIISD